ncbi:histone deacetylase family protein [Fodinibius sediminis]|uniref:Acetoin utilization deacetylase AcuC n=1 Tax=Fodinibius sediminis TaxID=1214077 RepID=A0A521B2F1_9BACT|nr:histone deacetylase [Fodinibius sediminis]SMO41205.1 Acetoin utilization deacetylase AcuC [Fodinibius sediminis]
MRVSYAPAYYAPLPEGHVFPMKKFTGLHRYLTGQQLIYPENVVAPSPVDVASLLTVHTREYVHGIMEGTLNRKQQRRLGLPWSRRLALRSRLAVQGTINAGLMALEDGIAGNLAGGTHHAMPGFGEGFCVFNDVAVAIKVLQQSMWAKRILVLDCDVHQGNGTAKVFENNQDVFTFSMHGEKNYPFKKPPSSLDIGLPDKTGDKVYLRTLGDALDDIFSQFDPDLVFYLGGIDPLEDDHFGRLSLSMKGLQNRDEVVIRTVVEKGIPLVLLLSGGYAPTVKETVLAHAEMYKKALAWAS